MRPLVGLDAREVLRLYAIGSGGGLWPFLHFEYI